MSYYETTWYTNAGDQATTGHYAVAKRASGAAVVAGQLVRQFTAPAVGSERVFICIIAGTTAVATDATWVLTRGAKTVDGTATWMECTGIAAVNGDKTNTVNWTQAKAIGVPTLGTVIQRNNGASYQICTTAGTLGAAEPAFSDTAGVTTTETSATTVWTSLGPVTNFTGGQAPHARLANACTTNWFAVGNTVYVGDNHAESQATAITIAPALTQATMGRIICHNHSGSYPPASANLATTATVSTTAAVAINFSPNIGTIYVYGLAFTAGVGQSTGSSNVALFPASAFYFFDACIFKIANTASNLAIVLNTTSAGSVIWNNCQASFANTNHFISVAYTDFTWRNTAQVLATGSTVPTNLLGQNTANAFSSIILETLDLSQWTSIFTSATPPASIGNWVVKDCKLNAAATFPNPVNTGQIIQVVRADGGATAYKSARYAAEGTETTETSITRVGGAADPTGQAQSRKIVTTANSQWLRPFRAEPYAIWNPTTGANVTVTVCGIVNSGALPNNDDVWLEVEYLGDAASTLGKIITTTKANLLAANAAVASDSSTWITPPFTTWNPSDSAGSVALSSSNVVATGTTISGGVRGINSLSSGKYYFEYTYTTISTNSVTLGIALASASLTSPGTGVAYVARSNGNIFVNGSTSGSTLGLIAIGTVLGIAVDFTSGLIWFRVAPAGNWNGSGTANPATGTGGVSISSISGALYPYCSTGNGDVVTANFGVSAFTGSVPSGFTAGFPGSGVYTPFKLTATLSSPQPGQAGYIHVRPRVAKPSMTVYLDPQVTLS